MIFALFCLLVLQSLWAQSPTATEMIPYSQFQTYLKEGRVAQVKISTDRFEGTFKQLLANETKHCVTNRVEPGLAAELLSQNVTFSSERENPLWTSFVSWIAPIMFLFATWVFVLGRVAQKGRIGSGGFMTIGKSKAKIYMEKDIHITFANEGALLAARRGRDHVGAAELQEAVERVVAGLEKKNRVLTREEKERVAYHEVGHALIALTLPGGGGTVQKISIVPRGVAALGYMLQVPTEDRFLMTKKELENKIAVLLGGRVAEELICRDISTGASDDLLKATDIAKSMVKTHGMSEIFGQVQLETGRTPTFLQNPQHSYCRKYSETTAREIDAEIRRIIATQYVRATQILGARQDVLRVAAGVLLQKETISSAELKGMLLPASGQAHHEDTQVATVH